MRRPASAYTKAISGGFLAAAAALGAALSDGQVTAGEWLIMAGAFITGALGVGAARNTQTAGTTGVLGQVLDATVGKLLPSGRRRG